MKILTKREQEIFDSLWKNANFSLEAPYKEIYSRQVKALATAIAVELAGLERKIKRLSGVNDTPINSL